MTLKATAADTGGAFGLVGVPAGAIRQTRTAAPSSSTTGPQPRAISGRSSASRVAAAAIERVGQIGGSRERRPGTRRSWTSVTASQES
jgi:hypothetical protein